MDWRGTGIHLIESIIFRDEDNAKPKENNEHSYYAKRIIIQSRKVNLWDYPKNHQIKNNKQLISNHNHDSLRDNLCLSRPLQQQIQPHSWQTHNYFYGEKVDEAEIVKLRGTSMFTSFEEASRRTSYQQHINHQKSVLNSTMSMNRSFRAANGMNELSVKSSLLESRDVHHQRSVPLAFTS